MKKLLMTAFIAVTSAVSFAQDYGLKTFTSDEYPYVRGLALSTDGKYIAGALGMSSEGSFIIDTENDYWMIYTAQSTGTQARGVSDTGVAVGYDIYPMTFSITGETTILEGGQGEASFAEGITPDGTIIVGSISDSENSWVGHACYWKDGELVLLPEPSKEDVGVEKTMDGTHAVKISADGSLIVGYFYDNWSTWPCIAWTLNEDGSYTCDPICKGLYEEDQDEDLESPNPYYTFFPTALSRNGKYIGLTLEKSNGDHTNYIGRYNVETKELEVADNSYSLTSTPGIADDGTMLASSSGNAYIWRPGKTSATRLIAEYPLVTEFVDYDTDGDHLPMDISPDGRYIMGFAWIYDDATATGVYGAYLFDTVKYEQAAGIASVENDENAEKSIYSIDGRKLNSLQHGINIVKKNGKTSKYIVR